MSTVAVVAPIAFLLGLLLGLLGSSAWRIVRRRDYDRWASGEPAEPPPSHVRLVEDDEP